VWEYYVKKKIKTIWHNIELIVVMNSMLKNEI